MRADRLLSILLQLQARGKTTTRELARKLEVSGRTIHRDMEALSAAGVPVYAWRGVRGGWELSEGYRTNLTGMKRDEILSLVLSTSTGAAGDPGQKRALDSALTKLLAAVPPAYQHEVRLVRERIHVDGAPWHGGSQEVPALPVLQEAVWADRKVTIQYPSESAPKGLRTRTVLPLGLVTKNKIWYLVALSEREPRTFRVSRIASAKLSAENFTRPPGFDLAAFWAEFTRDWSERLPRYPVRCRVRADYLPRFLRIPFLQARQTHARESGWVEVDANLETREWAVMMLAGLAERVEVLAPAELRRDLRGVGTVLAKVYGGK